MRSGTGLANDRFDQQAELFDQRAGFAPQEARRIAQAVLRIASISPGDIVLELGTGTGAIGSHFVDLGARYVGLDLSRPMLDVFRRRLPDPHGSLLVLADAEQPWPLQEHTAALVFASRVFHLLDPGRVLDEIRRVCRPGGSFIIGRITREPNSLKSRLRDQRLRLLPDRGTPRPRRGEGGRRLLDLCTASGYVPVAKRTVATWSGCTSAEKIIRDWEAMDPAEAGLASVRDWATRELGDLNRVEPYVERYTVEGVQLGGAAEEEEELNNRLLGVE